MEILVIFINLNCEFCAELLQDIKEITDVRFLIYRAMQSRHKDMIEILPHGHREQFDLPRLIPRSQLPAFPALFDPATGETVCGLDKIRDFFEDTELLTYSK